MPEAAIQLGVDLKPNGVAFQRDIETLARSIPPINVPIKIDSAPLGRIRGEIGEFGKSMDAASARLLAFGANASIFIAVGAGLHSIVENAIKVNAALVSINSITRLSDEGLKSFGNTLFAIAKNTGQSFSEVAEVANNFARQTSSVPEILRRTNDALVLTRITGLDVNKSLQALTTTVNTFGSAVGTSTDVLNKLIAVDQGFAVNAKDLADALIRSASSAKGAGVEFSQLAAIITTTQAITQRGGAVIGNSFKSIFSRLDRPAVLEDLQNLGIATQDISGKTLPAIQILQELAGKYDTLTDAQKSYTSQLVGGLYNINILRAALGDLGNQYGIYNRALNASVNAGDAAIARNALLSKSYESLINSASVNFTQLTSNIGNLTLGPAIKNIFGSIATLGQGANDSGFGQIGTNIGTGILKGIGNYISGPGLVLAGALALKFFTKFGSFAADAVKSTLNIGGISEKQKVVQQQINDLLQRQPDLYKSILASSNGELTISKQILDLTLKQIQADEVRLALTSKIAASLVGQGVRSLGAVAGSQTPARVATPFLASGFIPNYIENQERSLAQAHGYSAGEVIPYEIRGQDSGLTPQQFIQKAGIGKASGFIPNAVVNSNEYRLTRSGSDAVGIIPPNDMARIDPVKAAAKGYNISKVAQGFVPNFNIPSIGEILSHRYKVGNTQYDNINGAGQIPYTHDINYFGATALMRPQDYLKLALPIGEDSLRQDNSYRYLNHIRNFENKGFGIPYLQYGRNDKHKYQIFSHEGRHRALVAADNEEELIPVGLINSGSRAKALAMKNFKILNSEGLLSEGGKPKNIKDFIKGVYLNGEQHIFGNGFVPNFQSDDNDFINKLKLAGGIGLGSLVLSAPGSPFFSPEFGGAIPGIAAGTFLGAKALTGGISGKNGVLDALHDNFDISKYSIPKYLKNLLNFHKNLFNDPQVNVAGNVSQSIPTQVAPEHQENYSQLLFAKLNGEEAQIFLQHPLAQRNNDLIRTILDERPKNYSDTPRDIKHPDSFRSAYSSKYLLTEARLISKLAKGYDTYDLAQDRLADFKPKLQEYLDSRNTPEEVHSSFKLLNDLNKTKLNLEGFRPNKVKEFLGSGGKFNIRASGFIPNFEEGISFKHFKFPSITQSDRYKGYAAMTFDEDNHKFPNFGEYNRERDLLNNLKQANQNRSLQYDNEAKGFIPNFVAGDINDYNDYSERHLVGPRLKKIADRKKFENLLLAHTSRGLNGNEQSDIQKHLRKYRRGKFDFNSLDTDNFDKFRSGVSLGSGFVPNFESVTGYSTYNPLAPRLAKGTIDDATLRKNVRTQLSRGAQFLDFDNKYKTLKGRLFKNQDNTFTFTRPSNSGFEVRHFDSSEDAYDYAKLQGFSYSNYSKLSPQYAEPKQFKKASSNLASHFIHEITEVEQPNNIKDVNTALARAYSAGDNGIKIPFQNKAFTSPQSLAAQNRGEESLNHDASGNLGFNFKLPYSLNKARTFSLKLFDPNSNIKDRLFNERGLASEAIVQFVEDKPIITQLQALDSEEGIGKRTTNLDDSIVLRETLKRLAYELKDAGHTNTTLLTPKSAQIGSNVESNTVLSKFGKIYQGIAGSVLGRGNLLANTVQLPAFSKISPFFARLSGVTGKSINALRGQTQYGYNLPVKGLSNLASGFVPNFDDRGPFLTPFGVENQQSDNSNSGTDIEALIAGLGIAGIAGLGGLAAKHFLGGDGEGRLLTGKGIKGSENFYIQQVLPDLIGDKALKRRTKRGLIQTGKSFGLDTGYLKTLQKSQIANILNREVLQTNPTVLAQLAKRGYKGDDLSQSIDFNNNLFRSLGLQGEGYIPNFAIGDFIGKGFQSTVYDAGKYVFKKENTGIPLGTYQHNTKRGLQFLGGLINQDSILKSSGIQVALPSNPPKAIKNLFEDEKGFFQPNLSGLRHANGEESFRVRQEIGAAITRRGKSTRKGFSSFTLGDLKNDNILIDEEGNPIVIDLLANKSQKYRELIRTKNQKEYSTRKSSGLGLLQSRDFNPLRGEGFIPNFNALDDAISREASFGKTPVVGSAPELGVPIGVFNTEQQSKYGTLSNTIRADHLGRGQTQNSLALTGSGKESYLPNFAEVGGLEGNSSTGNLIQFDATSLKDFSLQLSDANRFLGNFADTTKKVDSSFSETFRKRFNINDSNAFSSTAPLANYDNILNKYQNQGFIRSLFSKSATSQIGKDAPEEIVSRASSIDQNRQTNRQQAFFGLSFVAPLIGGEVGQSLNPDGSNPRGERTAQGIGSAVGTFAQFTAFGLPQVGAVIGAFQGLNAIISNIKPNFEDLSKSAQEFSDKQREQIQNASQFIEAQSNLTDVIKNNGSNLQISLAQKQSSDALSQITDPKLRNNILLAQGPDQQLKAITDFTDSQKSIQNQKDIDAETAGFGERFNGGKAGFTGITDVLPSLARGDTDLGGLGHTIFQTIEKGFNNYQNSSQLGKSGIDVLTVGLPSILSSVLGKDFRFNTSDINKESESALKDIANKFSQGKTSLSKDDVTSINNNFSGEQQVELQKLVNEDIKANAQTAQLQDQVKQQIIGQQNLIQTFKEASTEGLNRQQFLQTDKFNSAQNQIEFSSGLLANRQEFTNKPAFINESFNLGKLGLQNQTGQENTKILDTAGQELIKNLTNPKFGGTAPEQKGLLDALDSIKSGSLFGQTAIDTLTKSIGTITDKTTQQNALIELKNITRQLADVGLTNKAQLQKLEQTRQLQFDALNIENAKKSFGGLDTLFDSKKFNDLISPIQNSLSSNINTDISNSNLNIGNRRQGIGGNIAQQNQFLINRNDIAAANAQASLAGVQAFQSTFPNATPGETAGLTPNGENGAGGAASNKSVQYINSLLDSLTTLNSFKPQDIQKFKNQADFSILRGGDFTDTFKQASREANSLSGVSPQARAEALNFGRFGTPANANLNPATQRDANGNEVKDVAGNVIPLLDKNGNHIAGGQIKSIQKINNPNALPPGYDLDENGNLVKDSDFYKRFSNNKFQTGLSNAFSASQHIKLPNGTDTDENGNIVYDPKFYNRHNTPEYKKSLDLAFSSRSYSPSDNSSSIAIDNKNLAGSLSPEALAKQGFGIAAGNKDISTSEKQSDLTIQPVDYKDLNVQAVNVLINGKSLDQLTSVLTSQNAVNSVNLAKNTRDQIIAAPQNEIDTYNADLEKIKGFERKKSLTSKEQSEEDSAVQESSGLAPKIANDQKTIADANNTLKATIIDAMSQVFKSGKLQSELSIDTAINGQLSIVGATGFDIQKALTDPNFLKTINDLIQSAINTRVKDGAKNPQTPSVQNPSDDGQNTNLGSGGNGT